MSSYEAGRRREYKVIHELMVDHNCEHPMRSAGSKGPADFIIAHPEQGTLAVQVGSPKKALSPADRERLCSFAEAHGALPILARVIPRQPIEYMHVTRELTGWERWQP